jgi:hypothetical protein
MFDDETNVFFRRVNDGTAFLREVSAIDKEEWHVTYRNTGCAWDLVPYSTIVYYDSGDENCYFYYLECFFTICHGTWQQ